MKEGFDILEIINVAGGISSAILGIIALLTFVVSQSKTLKGKIKNWFKESLGITELYNKIDKHMLGDKHVEMIQTQSNALLSLLKKELLCMATDCIEKEFVTMKELEVLNETYAAYKNLGGNSFMCDLMQKVKSLPVGNDIY